MRIKSFHLCMGLAVVSTLACSDEDEKLTQIANHLDSLSKRIERLEGTDRGTPAVASPLASESEPGAQPAPSAGDSTRVEPSRNAVSDRALDPGMVLDAWLWNGEGDLKLLTRDRSLGSTVARGELFRFNQINTDEALRSYWGRPMILKWSGYLKIDEEGPHSFAFELSKEETESDAYSIPIEARTIVEIGGVTMFEKVVRTADDTRIFEPDARVLRLRPGYYTVDVWFAYNYQHNQDWSLPLSTQLGTFIKIRPPSSRSPVPIQPSQVWHDRS